MKRTITLGCLIFCIISSVFGQVVTTNFTLNPNPSAVLSEWYNDNSVLTYITLYQEKTPLPAIIKTELKMSDGTIIATKDLTKAEIINIQQGTHVYYARDVIPLETMIFSGSYKSTIQKTGSLPAGTYQLTVQLVTPGDFVAITQAQSKFFNLMAPQLPILIKPRTGDTLKQKEAQTAIIFRWTPLVPITSSLPNYRIQVFEVYSYQQAVQALRSNQPLLDITVKGQTQYIWQPQISFIDEEVAKNFIWTIQTLDADNNPIVKTDGNGESRSEPMQFSVLSH